MHGSCITSDDALWGLQNVDSLTVLVVGKGGVGKSSTVNSLVGERVTVVSAFQVHYHHPVL